MRSYFYFCKETLFQKLYRSNVKVPNNTSIGFLFLNHIIKIMQMFNVGSKTIIILKHFPQFKKVK